MDERVRGVADIGIAGGAAAGEVTTPRRRRRLRVLSFAALAAFAAGVVGFGCFVVALPTAEIPVSEGADGIVVLTGGSSRLSDGMDLLAANRARRLLISGVRQGNGRTDISRTMPEHNQLLSCCVDLGRYAQNTRGNALEARRWAKERGFRSLIVVTSNYHMPRAVTEFAHAMPAVRLIPYPVVGATWRSEPWWTSGGTTRLLLVEYIKYLAAELRTRLNHAGVLPEGDEARFFGPPRRPIVASAD